MSTILTGDYLGRPRQILVGSTVIAIGAIIQTASYGVPQMMVGRVVAGLGTGMNTSTAGVCKCNVLETVRPRQALIQFTRRASGNQQDEL